VPHAANTGAVAALEKPDLISIRQRAGIWNVALNGAFYGDYARRDWAVEAALEKADDIAARGGAAVVAWTMDGQANARFYDTRRPKPSPLEHARRILDARPERT
jgi:hypothetical protein